MKKILYSACGGVESVDFTSTKKHVADDEDIDTLFDSAMVKAIKINKILKIKLRTTPTPTTSLIILTLKIQTLVQIPIWDHGMAMGNV